ncbi:hypothetical protein RF11_10686 [Thelohanellus kitauei]|uniref:Uncharacterized protein n=1 Tax=Thelohanellus kitauei TaxID=669202 RepID=A0A0C2N5X4_THEKT|nr:hypothetical protein RF11_10686 [Thelohanellus kitauei]
MSLREITARCPGDTYFLVFSGRSSLNPATRVPSPSFDHHLDEDQRIGYFTNLLQQLSRNCQTILKHLPLTQYNHSEPFRIKFVSKWTATINEVNMVGELNVVNSIVGEEVVVDMVHGTKDELPSVLNDDLSPDIGHQKSFFTDVKDSMLKQRLDVVLPLVIEIINEEVSFPSERMSLWYRSSSGIKDGGECLASESCTCVECFRDLSRGCRDGLKECNTIEYTHPGLCDALPLRE